MNTTTNELHLYPDDAIPMYYHKLFKVKIDQTGYEEEGLYKLALKYRYDDSVSKTKGAEEECHSHIVTDDIFSFDIMYKTQEAQCTSRIGKAMIYYENDVNACAMGKELKRAASIKKTEQPKLESQKRLRLSKVQKQLNHLAYQLHDIQPGFNSTKFKRFDKLPMVEHAFDASPEWVTLSDNSCFGPNVPERQGTFHVNALVEHVVEFKFVVSNGTGITCDGGLSFGTFGCKNLEEIAQVVLVEGNVTDGKRPRMIAPPEGTRDKSYVGHGEGYRWVGSCSTCKSLKVGANMLYTFQPGRRYKLFMPHQRQISSVI